MKKLTMEKGRRIKSETDEQGKSSKEPNQTRPKLEN